MQYNKKVMELFQNPKHVGTLDEADPAVGTGKIGRASCRERV